MAKFTYTDMFEKNKSVQAKTLKGARAKILDLVTTYHKYGLPSYGWSATIKCDGTPIGEIRILDFFEDKARWIGLKRNPATGAYRYTNTYFLNKDGSLGKLIGNAYEV